ncbi:MAG: ATP-binding protein [Patescibacteria group bacterium]
MGIVHISLVGIIALVDLIFGAKVFLEDRYNRVNQSFALFVAVSAVWIVFDFLAYQINLADYQLLINRIVFAAICVMILMLAWFVDIFPRKVFNIPKIVKYLVFLLAFMTTFLSLFTNLVVKDVSVESWGSNIISGKLFYIFAIYASILAIYSVVVLIVKVVKFRSVEKQQIKYILYGIAALTLLNLLFNLFIPMITKNFEYGRFGSYSSVLFVGFTAYAILKTKAFNLQIILTEIGVVILNVISVVSIFTSNSLTEGLLRFLFAIVVFYGSYILVQSVQREIEFRKQLQTMAEQLGHANAHLKELDKMKTEFVSLASHELLTPVSAIEGYLSMLLDEKLARVDDPKAAHYMDRVYVSAKRLARLVTDMLNVSRIEEGRLLVEKKEVSLTGIIEQTIDELKFKSEEGKQKLTFVDANHWETFGDPDKIKQILINLIGNSIKYSRNPGEIQIIAEIAPTAKVQEIWGKIENQIKNGPLDDQEAIKSAVDEKLKRLVGESQILIHIKDQGIGIPKEELPRLFKKFHRVGDFSTAESQGTGLGLYITRALVELHHGRVWADSEGSGKGSTFTFSLPEAKVQKEIQDLEAQVPQTKEQLKPLARPAKEAEDL